MYSPPVFLPLPVGGGMQSAQLDKHNIHYHKPNLPSSAPRMRTVRVGGLQVPGSPFHVDVLAGPARGANATVSGSALALATAGKNASFVIQARDREANLIDVEDNAIERLQEEAGTAFNVTLRRTGGVSGWSEDNDDNSTVVVDASVEYFGERDIYLPCTVGRVEL